MASKYGTSSILKYLILWKYKKRKKTKEFIKNEKPVDKWGA